MSTAVAAERRSPLAPQQLVREYETLGSAGGLEFIRTPDGSEYTVDRGFASEMLEGRRYLQVPETIPDSHGNPVVIGTRLKLLAPTAPGSFERIAARQERRGAQRERKAELKLVDGLALPLLAGTMPTILNLLPAAPPGPDDLIVSPGVLGRPAPRGLLTEGRGKIRGAAAILDLLTRKHITIEIVGDHLLVSAPAGRMAPGLRDLIERSAPLLRAHLAGTPLRCVRHPKVEAISLGVAGAPLCSEEI